MRVIAPAQEAALNQKSKSFSDHDVRVRAHRIWVNSGRPEGHLERHWWDVLNYWRQALAELEAEGLAQAKPELAPCDVSNSSNPDTTAPQQDDLELTTWNQGHA